PITIGVPVAGSDPVIMDMTTSMVAEGKLMVAVNRGDRVPEGWIIDKHGRPTTEPRDFYDGGALLTVGGHKGSGLSIVTDLLAGAISTGKSSDPADSVLRNNMLSIYIAPNVYDAEGTVAREAARFVAWIKASPPLNPDTPVLLPGEVERKMRAERTARAAFHRGLHGLARLRRFRQTRERTGSLHVFQAGDGAGPGRRHARAGFRALRARRTRSRCARCTPHGARSCRPSRARRGARH